MIQNEFIKKHQQNGFFKFEFLGKYKKKQNTDALKTYQGVRKNIKVYGHKIALANWHSFNKT